MLPATEPLLYLHSYADNLAQALEKNKKFKQKEEKKKKKQEKEKMK